MRGNEGNCGCGGEMGWHAGEGCEKEVKIGCGASHIVRGFMALSGS